VSGIEQTVHLKEWTSSADRALGADVRVEFGRLPRRIGKAYGHLAGFAVRMRINHTTAATSDAATGEEFYAFLDQPRMRVAGVDLFKAGLDGRDIRDDAVFRNGQPLIKDPSDVAANHNTTGETVDVTVIYRFADVDGDHARDGLISLALLDHLKDPDTAFEFTLGSAMPLAATGWTINSIDALNAWAILRYEPDEVRGPLPVLGAKNFDEDTATVLPAVAGAVTRLDYAVVRPTLEETGGQDVSAWTGITIRQEERTLQTKDADEMGLATTIDVVRPRTGTPPDDCDPETGGYLALFLPRPYADTNEKISADVGLTVKSRNQHTRTRILSRQLVAFTQAMKNEAARYQVGAPEPIATRSLPAQLLTRRLVK